MLRNALLPIVTITGLQVGAIFGGTVVVETVFGWPGVGRLAHEAVFSRDVNLLLGIFPCSSLMVDRRQSSGRPALRGAPTRVEARQPSTVQAIVLRRFALQRINGSRALAVGLVLLAAVAFVAATAGQLYPGDPRDMVAPASIWPGVDHRFPLELGMMGRDTAAASWPMPRASR